MIGPYIADFCCFEAKLILEVDGNQHGFETQRSYDEKRSEFLQAQGYRVLRFSNHDVMTAIDMVLDTIYAAVATPTPTPDPSPQGGGEISRRAIFVGLGAAALAPGFPDPARAALTESHGLSVFGDLKYPAGFSHFDYVDPAAPKGGSFSHQIASVEGNQNFDTFNTLNIYVLKGDGAAGMGLTFDSLMMRALDEPDAMYGLVARAVRHDEDRLDFRFLLRAEARFHDGSQLTARDVAFSLATLKTKGHPRIAQTLRFLLGAEAETDDIVRVTFAPERGRDLPLIVAGLPIFSEAYYRSRDFEASTLEPPLGSGPYRVARVEVGRSIVFERVRDHWAAALPVVIGQNNFDEIRYEYFRDRQVALEAFKAGAFTFREEFTARDWATGYDFPAIREGKVRRDTVPDDTPSGTQGWFLNTRRAKFQDRRIREAVGLAFDFEWTNTNLMFSAYKRTVSYFENSDLKAVAPPTAAEVALLEPWRGKVPDEVFGEPYAPPVSDGSGQDRSLLRRADQQLREAGCRRENNVLKLPNGEPFEIEFLDFQPSLQPHTQPFIKNLGLLGIQGRARIVDAAQYQRRTDEFDFDTTVRRFNSGMTPGEQLKVVFSSQAAATNGSSNLSGVADPAVDALLDHLVGARTREELTVAGRALDRVLRAGRYWVPMWYLASHRLAYWDLFGHPPAKPRYGLGAPGTWWYDPEKAKRIGRA